MIFLTFVKKDFCFRALSKKSTKIWRDVYSHFANVYSKIWNGLSFLYLYDAHINGRVISKKYSHSQQKPHVTGIKDVIVTENVSLYHSHEILPNNF